MSYELQAGVQKSSHLARLELLQPAGAQRLCTRSIRIRIRICISMSMSMLALAAAGRSAGLQFRVGRGGRGCRRELLPLLLHRRKLGRHRARRACDDTR